MVWSVCLWECLHGLHGMKMMLSMNLSEMVQSMLFFTFGSVSQPPLPRELRPVPCQWQLTHFFRNSLHNTRRSPCSSSFSYSSSWILPSFPHPALFPPLGIWEAIICFSYVAENKYFKLGKALPY